jgi:hypothetical protein
MDGQIRRLSMRKMKEGIQTLNVIEFIITKNFWEYYVIEIDENDIAFCLVDGFEIELGYVCLNEIKPYISCRTKDLTRIEPARGWKWVN